MVVLKNRISLIPDCWWKSWRFFAMVIWYVLMESILRTNFSCFRWNIDRNLLSWMKNRWHYHSIVHCNLIFAQNDLLLIINNTQFAATTLHANHTLSTHLLADLTSDVRKEEFAAFYLIINVIWLFSLDWCSSLFVIVDPLNFLISVLECITVFIDVSCCPILVYCVLVDWFVGSWVWFLILRGVLKRHFVLCMLVELINWHYYIIEDLRLHVHAILVLFLRDPIFFHVIV